MLVAKMLADRCALIEQCPLSGGENQLLRTVLKSGALSAPAEYVFVVIDFNDFSRWKFCQNFLRARMVPNRFLYIDM